MRLLFAILLVAFQPGAANAQEPAAPSAHIVFAAGINQVESRVDPVDIRDRYGCGEAVHAVIAVEGLSIGSHEMTARWLDPNGVERKNQRGRLDVPRNNWIAYLTSSIAVVPESASTPTSDEKSPFAGNWMVEVISDGAVLGAATFTIDC